MRALSIALRAALVSAVSTIGCLSIAGLDEDFTEAGAAGGGGAGATGGGGPGAAACEPLTEADCYGGPEGTEGVGLCVGGTRTCNAQGTAYGECVGQVLPSAEDCATPDTDENCDGLTPCSGAAIWSKRFGEDATQSQFATGVAVDRFGNVFITGGFFGHVNFGGETFQQIGARDLFLAKFDSAGTHLWSKAFGSSAPEIVGGLGIDADGNCVLTGGYSGLIDFCNDPLPSPAGYDVFVAVFGAESGDCVYSKGFPFAGDQLGRSAVLDAQGSTTVVGQLVGTVSFGGPDLSAGPSNGMFAVRLGANGGHLWSNAFSGDGGDLLPHDLAAGEDGVIISGSVIGGVDFGCGELLDSGGGSKDAFVVELGDDGACHWNTRFGGPGVAGSFGIAALPGGGAVVTGAFNGTIDIDIADDCPALTSAGGDDIFVTRLGAGGECVWNKRFGDAADQAAIRVALSDGGDIVIAGYFEGQLDLGDVSPLVSMGSHDAFVARLDGSGEIVRWRKSFGDAAEQDALGVALDESGAILVTGEFGGTIELGGETHQSTGIDDIFLAKLSP